MLCTFRRWAGPLRPATCRRAPTPQAWCSRRNASPPHVDVINHARPASYRAIASRSAEFGMTIPATIFATRRVSLHSSRVSRGRGSLYGADGRVIVLELVVGGIGDKVVAADHVGAVLRHGPTSLEPRSCHRAPACYSGPFSSSAITASARWNHTSAPVAGYPAFSAVTVLVVRKCRWGVRYRQAADEGAAPTIPWSRWQAVKLNPIDEIHGSQDFAVDLDGVARGMTVVSAWPSWAWSVLAGHRSVLRIQRRVLSPPLCNSPASRAAHSSACPAAVLFATGPRFRPPREDQRRQRATAPVGGRASAEPARSKCISRNAVRRGQQRPNLWWSGNTGI